MSQNLETIRRRGVTLVELLVALAVVAVLSTAVAILLTGAGKIHQYVNNETDAISQVENAYRRMMHNIRTSSATPTAVSNVLTVRTQPDSSYSGTVASSGATVVYKKDTSGNVVEVDDRFNTNILIPASANPDFIVTATTLGAPTQVTITITAFPGSQYQVTRTAVITCRNF